MLLSIKYKHFVLVLIDKTFHFLKLPHTKNRLEDCDCSPPTRWPWRIRRTEPTICTHANISFFPFHRPTATSPGCTAWRSRRMLKSSVSLTQIHRKSISNGRSIIQPRALTSQPAMYHVTVSRKMLQLRAKWRILTQFPRWASGSRLMKAAAAGLVSRARKCEYIYN